MCLWFLSLNGKKVVLCEVFKRDKQQSKHVMRCCRAAGKDEMLTHPLTWTDLNDLPRGSLVAAVP